MSVLHGTVTQICYVTHDLEKAIKRWAEGVKAGSFSVQTTALLPERAEHSVLRETENYAEGVRALNERCPGRSEEAHG